LNFSNTAVTSLSATWWSGLTALTANNCTALTSLTISSCSKLSSISVSGCTNLSNLDCRSNKLGTLDITGDHGITTSNYTGNPSVTITGP
jgi:Leucine-rich repeat (LRR) protein